jgi:hypothetical protein
MTEEEINKAIEVYYPGEDLGPRPQGFIDGAWFGYEYCKLHPNEMAEEFTKNIIHFLRDFPALIMTDDPEHIIATYKNFCKKHPKDVR